MIRTLIVDDEVKGRLFIRQLCEKFEPRIKVQAEAANAAEALEIISLEPPDLVFLDIEMPGMSGIEMLRTIGQISFEVVFVTAFNQYAVEAFRLGAVDYLLKPVHPADLRQAIDRVEKNLSLVHKTPLADVARNFGQPFSKITIPSLNGFEFIDFKDIMFLESDSNYTLFHLKDGKKITATRTLGDFEELLENHGFFRIHKSYIIRLEAIRKYIKGEGGVVVMEDGTEIDVSRRKKESFLDRIKL